MTQFSTRRPSSTRRMSRISVVGCAVGVIGACLPMVVQAAPQTFTVITYEGLAVSNAAVSVLVRGAPSQAAPGTTAEMSQRQRAFVPGVLAIQAGTAVNFPNFDTVRHHVYSFSPTKPFEIKLYSGTPAKPVVFDKAGTATLGCNIHDRMMAYIHVVNTPYVGVTDGMGRVTIDVPDGEHKVRIWTPAMGEANPGVERTIRAGAGPVTLRLGTN
ncbi:MAG: methylamine utilization protein [Aquabacterium sp.]